MQGWGGEILTTERSKMFIFSLDFQKF